MEELGHKEIQPEQKELVNLIYKQKDRKLLTSITLIISVVFWVFVSSGLQENYLRWELEE